MGGGFTVGKVPPGAIGTPLWRADDLEHVQIGQVIAPLNDYVLVWDENCVKPAELETWRRHGDPLCDEVVRVLKLRSGQDGLERILAHLELPLEEQDPCVRTLWDEISRLPPLGVSALPPSSDPASKPSPPECSPRAALASPNFAPPPTLAQGQAVFWRYAAQIFGALLHFSLAGGFSATRVVRVLDETGYLTGDERDRTYRRLLETTQAILDYMNDMTPVTGIGWKSAVRVRMLHASVRVRMAEGRGVKKVYDEAVDGVPINQEDLIATLGSFAIAPLWSLRRMGFTLRPEEEAAYVATWRHIGYYLGISPDRLARYYTHPSVAEKLFASNTMHLFSSDVVTTDFRLTSTYRLLHSTTGRPPFRRTIEESLCLSRILLADGLADRLALPRVALTRRARTRMGFAIQRALHFFGEVWRPGWEAERVQVTRLLVSMVVCWQMGTRRTRFTLKKEEKEQSGRQGTGEGEGEGFGVKGEAQKSEEEDDNDVLDPEVEMGPEAGKRMIRRWKWLLAEMGAVVGSAALMAAVTVWAGWRWTVGASDLGAL